MGTAELRTWIRLSLFSLMIVALYGMLMRYKIAFSFPFLDQRNLLHAHSHFALSGWLSMVLYTGLALILTPHASMSRMRKYRWLIGSHFAASVGMLIGFTIQGYGPIAFVFLSLTIIVAIAFAKAFANDSKYMPNTNRSKSWAMMAVLFNVVSAVGPLYLVLMIISGTLQSEDYLAASYYYLHFQYNGWFFFGSAAVVTYLLPKELPDLKKYFNLFALTVLPTFFLSTLWAKLPIWLYIITLVATLVQLYAWLMLLRRLWPYLLGMMPGSQKKWVRIFFYASILALTLKFLLQTVSVVPSLSQLVFGFRPIVIAYLHLVLLGVYSLFFIGFLFTNGYIYESKATRIAGYGFLTGVVLNELALAIQGAGAFAYKPIPYINQILFGIAVLLFLSASGLAMIRGNRPT